METHQRIDIINNLNGIGIRLSRVPTLEESLGIHRIAAILADDASLNPDYLAVSNANQAYVLRQQGNYDAAQMLLMQTLKRIESPARTLPRTYAGRGRIYEELGIVTADAPLSVEAVFMRIPQIKKGLSFFERAITNYDAAITSKSTDEIYDLKQLQQRRLRTIGMRSPKARDLYELIEGEEQNIWLNRAVEYALGEVTAREDLGETAGQNLANAYHTLGQALTETVVNIPGNYARAKEMFDKAATVPGVHPNTQVTLQLRRAWLEYRCDPHDQEAIRPFFDSFLADTNPLTGADRNALQGKVLELGCQLGESYQERVRAFIGH